MFILLNDSNSRRRSHQCKQAGSCGELLSRPAKPRAAIKMPTGQPVPSSNAPRARLALPSRGRSELGGSPRAGRAPARGPRRLSRAGARRVWCAAGSGPSHRPRRPHVAAARHPRPGARLRHAILRDPGRRGRLRHRHPLRVVLGALDRQQQLAALGRQAISVQHLLAGLREAMQGRPQRDGDQVILARELIVAGAHPLSPYRSPAQEA
jgi:hypothetical protein